MCENNTNQQKQLPSILGNGHIPFNQQTNAAAALYPLYQLLNNPMANTFNISTVKQEISNQITSSNQVKPLINQQQQQRMIHMMEKQLKHEEQSHESIETDDDQLTEQIEEDDEELADDEEMDDYDDDNEFDNNSMSHSLLKQSQIQQHHPNALVSGHEMMISSKPLNGSTIKTEQNEKMIKKNKVIELYSKGERCVRKLSQLTGVPLTTVYRVIGKLKGINYNIPRGNGAGRKTILDAQDREILVEILNNQPRISRKALGKELEKRTGKSIHNSTLNRELCRLRHHGHNFAAVHAVAGNSMGKNLDHNMNGGTENHNYLKHFNNIRKSRFVH